MKTRAHSLVSRSIRNKSKSSWYSLLDTISQAYIHEIIIEMQGNPEAQFNFVADEIRREFGLTVSAGTIARTLREMIRNAEKES